MANTLDTQLEGKTFRLTKGDIRISILSHLQFTVSEQAILLGISPTSVTKARQRLKARLQ